MERIGIFELKTHLSDFVHRVQNGEEFFITNRGETVARLCPTYTEESTKEAAFFTKFRKILKSSPLANNLTDLKSMIEKGRK